MKSDLLHIIQPIGNILNYIDAYNPAIVGAAAVFTTRVFEIIHTQNFAELTLALSILKNISDKIGHPNDVQVNEYFHNYNHQVTC